MHPVRRTTRAYKTLAALQRNCELGASARTRGDAGQGMTTPRRGLNLGTCLRASARSDDSENQAEYEEQLERTRAVK